MRQGDILSPTLFSIFLNDLATTIKDSGLGVNYYNNLVNILLYADDILLMAENPEDLQSLLNIVSDWCEKWRLSINNKKTQIMHVRKQGKRISEFNFYYGKNYGTREFPIPSNNCVLLEYTATYKYFVS